MAQLTDTKWTTETLLVNFHGHECRMTCKSLPEDGPRQCADEERASHNTEGACVVGTTIRALTKGQPPDEIH